MNWLPLMLIVLLLAILIFWFCYREIRNAMVIPVVRPRRKFSRDTHEMGRRLKHYILAKHPGRRI